MAVALVQRISYRNSVAVQVLKSFGDPEPRVRYYACESLFNITKICRGAILRYFAEVFVGCVLLLVAGDKGQLYVLCPSRPSRVSVVVYQSTVLQCV
jgi:hypothetical protein